MTRRRTFYLGSPLGFARAHRAYLRRVEARLRACGADVLNPWDAKYELPPLDRPHREVLDAYRALAEAIGDANRRALERAQAGLFVLDGMEPDSGTCAEAAYLAGRGRPAFALRADVRDAGEFPGVPLSLQLLHFVRASGGRLFRSLREITPGSLSPRA